MPKKDSGKVKVDPKKVIVTKPKMIRENFSKTKKEILQSQAIQKIKMSKSYTQHYI
jgi:hypothetical protein